MMMMMMTIVNLYRALRKLEYLAVYGRASMGS